MLQEVKTTDVIQILEDGSISVRIRTDIVKNDSEILATSYARTILSPGEYDLAKDLLKGKYAVAEAIWTEEVLEAHKKKLSSITTKKPQ